MPRRELGEHIEDYIFRLRANNHDLRIDSVREEIERQTLSPDEHANARRLIIQITSHMNNAQMGGGGAGGVRLPEPQVWNSVSTRWEPEIPEDVFAPEQEEENSKNTPKMLRLTSEIESRLFTANERLTVKYLKKRKTEAPSNQGRREQQYAQMLIKEKKDSLSITEIITSEIPLLASTLGNNKLQEIAITARHPDIVGDGRTTPLRLRCATCTLNTPSVFAYFFNSRVYCAEHVPDAHMCKLCEQMRAKCTVVTTFDGKELMVCPDCIKQRKTCGHCGNQITKAFIEKVLCQQCTDTPDTREPSRNFSYSLKWASGGVGEIVKTTRMFSCEIEGMTPLREWGYALCQNLPKEIGVTRDGSLDPLGENLHGFEVQTPRLVGKKGEELVHRMITVLKKVDTSLNETCGMHVHLDGKGLIPADRTVYPAALIQLLKVYTVFEDVFLSFLPHDRRRNDFCRPMADIIRLAEVEMLDSVLDVEKLWYKERTYNGISNAKQHHYHASRYFGANFGSLLHNGHFEVRFHSGTTNPRKILEWANLHALVMDACVGLAFPPEFLQSVQQLSRLSERTTLLFDAIGLAETSRQYFRARQKKFGDRKREDEEVKRSSHKGAVRDNRNVFISGTQFNNFVYRIPEEMAEFPVNATTAGVLTPENLERTIRQIRDTNIEPVVVSGDDSVPVQFINPTNPEN